MEKKREDLNVIKRETDAGADLGNNSIKIVLDGRHLFQYKSVAKARNEDSRLFKANENPKHLFGQDLKNKLDVRVTSNCFRRPRGFVIGTESIEGRTGKDIERTADAKKYNDSQLAMWLISTLAHSYVMNMTAEELESVDELDLDVNMCVGLPYNEINRGETGKNKVIFSELLKGTHKIEFMDKASYPVDTVNVTIKELIIDTEGLSALRYAVNERKLTRNSTLNLENNICTLIDIGAGSIDVASCTFRKGENGLKLEYLPNFSYGESESIAEIYGSIAQEITEASDDSSITFKKCEIEKAYFNNGKLEGDTEDRYGIVDRFEEKVEILGESVAEKLMTECRKLYRPDNLKKAFVVGGGANSEVLTEAFIDKMKKNNFEHTDIEVITGNEGTHANAYGYYKVLMHKMKKK